jgi:hypothetical protein
VKDPRSSPGTSNTTSSTPLPTSPKLSQFSKESLPAFCAKPSRQNASNAPDTRFAAPITTATNATNRPTLRPASASRYCRRNVDTAFPTNLIVVATTVRTGVLDCLISARFRSGNSPGMVNRNPTTASADNPTPNNPAAIGEIPSSGFNTTKITDATVAKPNVTSAVTPPDRRTDSPLSRRA